MATEGGPKIVTDGLVLHLDAANPKSYPGSGTVWKDLSGNGNDGTLVNGPMFDNGNNGSIVFDGVNDYITLPAIDTHSSTTRFTVEGIVRPIDGNWCRIFTNGSNGTTGPTGFINVDLLVLTASRVPYLYLRVGNSTIFKTQISTNSWSSNDFLIHFAFSVDKENRTGTYLFKFAQNTGLIQTELSGDFTPGTTTGFVENRLGAETNNENYMNMEMYVFKMYDRDLNIAELRQNYNATKSRFNL